MYGEPVFHRAAQRVVAGCEAVGVVVGVMDTVGDLEGVFDGERAEYQALLGRAQEAGGAAGFAHAAA